MKKEKGFIFNHKTITIRGSFINMLFTMVLMTLFIVAAFRNVCEICGYPEWLHSRSSLLIFPPIGILNRLQHFHQRA